MVRGKLDAAKHLIEVSEVGFRGSPRFRDDGSEYVPEDDRPAVAYVGTPRREIDHAWALLHWGTTCTSLPIGDLQADLTQAGSLSSARTRRRARGEVNTRSTGHPSTGATSLRMF